MMRKLVIIVLTLAVANTACAQLSGRGDAWHEARFNIKLGDIGRAVEYYAAAVQQAAAHRNAGRGVSGELMAEYAYALALNGDYELSLMYIDRARGVGARHADFYTAQILTLTGHADAARALDGTSPEWLDGIWQNRVPRDAVAAPRLATGSPNATLKRAVKLCENGQHVQAMVLLEELMAQYPSEPMVLVAYSTLWEAIGKPNQAALMLKRGIELTSKNDTSRLRRYEEHLATLSHTSPHAWSQFCRTIVYAGTSVGENMFGINGRVGLSTKSLFSLSLTGSYSSWSGTPVASVGLSAYKSWSWLVVGLGTTCQWSDDKRVWGLSPSLGVALYNTAGTASIDITIGTVIPFSSDDHLSYSLSIGRTVYLDFGKERRHL